MIMIFSAGIVPVRKIKGKFKYLMLRNRGYWDFPKGKLDEGETHLKAAIRELEEETKLTDIELTWGQSFIETEPYPTKNKKKKSMKVARYYLAEAISGDPQILPNPETGEKEHNEFRWLTYKQAQKLELHPRIVTVLEWAQQMIDP